VISTSSLSRCAYTLARDGKGSVSHLLAEIDGFTPCSSLIRRMCALKPGYKKSWMVNVFFNLEKYDGKLQGMAFEHALNEKLTKDHFVFEKKI
jgi:hypothetical protein